FSMCRHSFSSTLFPYTTLFRSIPDVVVTNFNDQYHSLFMGSASFPYQDQTIASHLAQFSKADVGWGTKFLDYDNDGNPDLIIAKDRKSTRLNSSHVSISYAVFC